jgi:nitroreductase
MNEMLEVIEARRSARVPFDQTHPIAGEDLLQILEAARWAPTAHNMQNFEIIVIDDQKLLDQIGTIRFQLTEAFLRENVQLLSFSEEELRQKRVGVLAAVLPAAIRDPDPMKMDPLASKGIPLSRLMPSCPALLILMYDDRKRAPASEGDMLGIMSLGCVLENMWLVADSLNLGFHTMDVFGMPSVEPAVKDLLAIPTFMKIAVAARVGYPVATSRADLTVRREVGEFTHWNRFGSMDRDHQGQS